jgi:hypothetical protein
MKVRVIPLIVLTCLFGLTSCFADDMYLGTWKLNESKSKLGSGMPKNHTVLYQAVGDKVRVIVDGVDANGKPTHTEWNGKFDGEYYPVIGDPMSDTRAYKKIDDRTLEMTLKKADSVVATVKIVIAADGKSRTVSVSVKNPAGKTIEEMAVYDKQ